MSEDQITSISKGRHRDPFSFLGPHENQIRAWLPQARAAWVVSAWGSTPMESTGVTGFYIATFGTRPDGYSIRVELYSGEVRQFEDPYRFPPMLTAFELHLHGEGTNYESYRTLGAHLVNCEGVDGVRFAVWAPNAEVVSVVSDVNQWDRTRHPMRLRDGGIWELFMPGVGAGTNYKYSVLSRAHPLAELKEQDKSDPYGFFAEVPPRTASIVWPLSNYGWNDGGWMEARAGRNWLREPVSAYEVHLESWMRGPFSQLMTYRELADKLTE
ncbi:MAG: GlgB N-terminal domain-containing protein, partial [Bryobacteraceae bacterium]